MPRQVSGNVEILSRDTIRELTRVLRHHGLEESIHVHYGIPTTPCIDSRRTGVPQPDLLAVDLEPWLCFLVRHSNAISRHLALGAALDRLLQQYTRDAIEAHIALSPQTAALLLRS